MKNESEREREGREKELQQMEESEESESESRNATAVDRWMLNTRGMMIEIFALPFLLLERKRDEDDDKCA